MKVYVAIYKREIPCEPTESHEIEAVFSTEELAKSYCEDLENHEWEEWEVDELVRNPTI